MILYCIYKTFDSFVLIEDALIPALVVHYVCCVRSSLSEDGLGNRTHLLVEVTLFAARGMFQVQSALLGILEEELQKHFINLDEINYRMCRGSGDKIVGFGVRRRIDSAKIAFDVYRTCEHQAFVSSSSCSAVLKPFSSALLDLDIVTTIE